MKKISTIRIFRKRIIILSCFLAFFILISALTLTGVFQQVEDGFFVFASSMRTPVLTTIITFITDMADVVSIVLMLILLVIIPQTRKKMGIPLTVTAIISVSFNEVLKVIFGRPRPYYGDRLIDAARLSFPSGHAQGATAFYIAIVIIILLYFKKRKIFIPLIVACITITFLVGFSRVYLGVHYLGDILAGWALGVVIALAINMAWEAMYLKIPKDKKFHKLVFDSVEPLDKILNAAQVEPLDKILNATQEEKGQLVEEPTADNTKQDSDE